MVATGAVHHRRSIRLKGHDYSDPGAYFVTRVTHQRRLLLGEILDDAMKLSGPGRIAQSCWGLIPDHFPFVELGGFVVMPNHLHGILILHDRVAMDLSVGARHAVPNGACHGMPLRKPGFGAPQAGSLATIVRQYKGSVTRMLRPEFGVGQIWQRNYYERIIRDHDEWNRIHMYIEANPSAWVTDEENPALAGP